MLPQFKISAGRSPQLLEDGFAMRAAALGRVWPRAQRAHRALSAAPEFGYHELFPMQKDAATPYRRS